jgi:death-on-curing protein
MAKRKTVQRLTILQIETVAHYLAREMFHYSEPIPDFVTRFPHKLESCLNTPFQKWGGRSLYLGIVGKGAVLFYFMIKNHPFQNGNKRIAVMTLFYFLSRNDKWLKVTNDELYEFAREVAKSDPVNREVVVKNIRSFIRMNMIPLR